MNFNIFEMHDIYFAKQNKYHALHKDCYYIIFEALLQILYKDQYFILTKYVYLSIIFFIFEFKDIKSELF